MRPVPLPPPPPAPPLGPAAPAGLDRPGQAARPAWREPALLGGLAAAGTALLAVVDPNTTHVPLCPLKAITGLDCPFCGSLRAVHALTRFDLGAAADHNLLFTVSVPFLVVGWAVWMGRAVREPDAPRRRHARLDLALLLIALAFGVIRNLPAFAWLGSGA